MLKKIVHIYRDSFSQLSTEIWLLATIMVINRMGAMILTFASLYMIDELDFSLTQAGYIMGAYGIGSIVGAYIGGELSDRFGAYHVQLASLLLSAMMLVIFILLTSFYAIIVCMFVYALLTDMLRPANSVAVALFSTEQNRSRSYSLMRFAANLGFAIGPAIGGIIAGTMGYKYIFLIDICSCIIAAFILFKYLRPQTGATLAPTSAEHKTTRSLSRSAYRDGEYLFFIVLVSLYGITFFQLFASLPVFLKQDWDWSEQKVGLLLALNGLFIVLFEMPFMRQVEGKLNPWRMMMLGGLALVLAYIAILTDIHSLFLVLDIRDVCDALHDAVCDLTP
jgi:MFS family permease